MQGNSSPKISVLLPYLNAGETLERAINSICRQDFHDFELVLIDNGSTDGSQQIAGKLSQSDNRIMLTRESRRGVAYATNRGAALASGQYIARMDADDEALPSRLRLQTAYLDDHPECDAVAGLAEHVPHSDLAGGFSRFVEWSNGIRSYEQIYNNRFIELPVVNPTLMWRRAVGEQHGLYRQGNFPEDYEMILRWLGAGVRVVKIPEVILKWYDSDNRLTRTDEAYSDLAFYRIKSSYLAAWLQSRNPFHPDVAVWGASRISRRRVRLLEKQGIHVNCYIDTKKGRQIGKKVIYYQDLPEAGSMMILSYIRQMDNRDRIRAFLQDKGYREGVDFIMVS